MSTENEINGRCIVLTLIIRSFLWQLYDKVFRLFLIFIPSSETLKE